MSECLSMTHLKFETQKLKVKSGIISWELLWMSRCAICIAPNTESPMLLTSAVFGLIQKVKYFSAQPRLSSRGLSYLCRVKPSGWLIDWSSSVLRRVVNETYDAETETRLRRQSLEKRPRRDVKNNVSRRSVETLKPWLVIRAALYNFDCVMCNPPPYLGTLLWVCMCVLIGHCASHSNYSPTSRYRHAQLSMCRVVSAIIHG